MVWSWSNRNPKKRIRLKRLSSSITDTHSEHVENCLINKCSVNRAIHLTSLSSIANSSVFLSPVRLQTSFYTSRLDLKFIKNKKKTTHLSTIASINHHVGQVLLKNEIILIKVNQRDRTHFGRTATLRYDWRKFVAHRGVVVTCVRYVALAFTIICIVTVRLQNPIMPSDRGEIHIERGPTATCCLTIRGTVHRSPRSFFLCKKRKRCRIIKNAKI